MESKQPPRSPAPKDPETFLVNFGAERLQRIDNVRFTKRLASRTEAIRWLIDESLKKFDKTA